MFNLIMYARLRNICFFTALMSMVLVWLFDALSIKSGVEHKVQFSYCTCEPLIKTLCRAQLWPATPCNPHYVFSFALLDWAEALLLECQVALKDFCSALNFLFPPKRYNNMAQDYIL